MTRDVPLPLLEMAQGIAPLAEPEAVGQEQGTQTGIAAFFTTGQANLAADNPCGDDLRALAEGTRVYFPSGGVKAEESGLVQARVLGRIAQECPNYTLQVRGHSDPTGDPAVNFRLSEKRANALIRLMGSSGIDTTDFITLGMGSAEPSNVAGPLGAAYYDRRVDFAVVERVKTASAASGFQQTWAAPTAAEPACVSALHVRAEQTRLFYNARAITVSPSELGPVYELAQEVMACGGAWLRVMGHHSDVNGDSESVKTGRLRALVLMGSLAAAGYDEERILVGAPSFSAAVDNQPTLPRSRVDFQIIVD